MNRYENRVFRGPEDPDNDPYTDPIDITGGSGNPVRTLGIVGIVNEFGTQ